MRIDSLFLIVLVAFVLFVVIPTINKRLKTKRNKRKALIRDEIRNILLDVKHGSATVADATREIVNLK